MSNNTATITYLRYDGTAISIPKGIPQNFILHIYHVVDSDSLNKSIDSLTKYVLNDKHVRQKFILGAVINKNIAEWDNLNVKLTGLDDKSMIIIFTLQKIRSIKPGIVIDNIIDFSYISSAQSVLQKNNNLVYNTDNYYLLEMNSAIDTFNNSNNNHQISHNSIINNKEIADNYHLIYDILLENEINELVNQRATNSIYTPEQLNELKQQMREITLKNKDKMDSFEKIAIKEFNDQFRSSFYSKYIGDIQHGVTGDILDTINDKIHNTKCLLPLSTNKRSDANESAIRLSIHYHM
jgi:hypothetical protein